MWKLPVVCTNFMTIPYYSAAWRSALLPALVMAAALLAAPTCLAAKKIPLPRPKPAALVEMQPGESDEPDTAEPSEEQSQPAAAKDPGPSACQLRLSNIAAIEPVPAIVGPGECGGEDLVRIDAIKLKDKSSIPITPAANLRCSMAEAIAIWVREDIAPITRELGEPMRALDNFASYHCRGRNNIIGAKMSEHGRGNALDIRGVMLAKTKLEWTDVHVSRKIRDKIKASACARFMTVLGPGSDGYHENHIHVDLAERRNNHRMCQWDVRDPPGEKATPEDAAEEVAAIPLPRPKPAEMQHRRRL
jgi:hypothetical protein